MPQFLGSVPLGGASGGGRRWGDCFRASRAWSIVKSSIGGRSACSEHAPPAASWTLVFMLRNFDGMRYFISIYFELLVLNWGNLFIISMGNVALAATSSILLPHSGNVHTSGRSEYKLRSWWQQYSVYQQWPNQVHEHALLKRKIIGLAHLLGMAAVLDGPEIWLSLVHVLWEMRYTLYSHQDHRWDHLSQASRMDTSSMPSKPETPVGMLVMISCAITNISSFIMLVTSDIFLEFLFSSLHKKR